MILQWHEYCQWVVIEHRYKHSIILLWHGSIEFEVFSIKTCLRPYLGISWCFITYFYGLFSYVLILNISTFIIISIQLTHNTIHKLCVLLLSILFLEQFIVILLISILVPILQKWKQIQFTKGMDTYSFILVNVITWQSLGQIWCYILLMTL